MIEPTPKDVNAVTICLKYGSLKQAHDTMNRAIHALAFQQEPIPDFITEADMIFVYDYFGDWNYYPTDPPEWEKQ